MQLDTIDKKILRVVQKNSNVTHENLASIVGLSASACSRRLTNLRKTGVIKKEVAVLNSKFIGPRVSMLVTVTLEREQLNVINAFKIFYNATDFASTLLNTGHKEKNQATEKWIGRKNPHG